MLNAAKHCDRDRCAGVLSGLHDGGELLLACGEGARAHNDLIGWQLSVLGTTRAWGLLVYRTDVFQLSEADRSRSALAMTETELKLIAAAAIIGLSSMPNTG